MRLLNYINEDIDKTFIRLGPMSGQKQKHKGSKQAPAKKGVWLLPIQAGAYDLCFLGGYQEKTKRLEIIPKQFKKKFGVSYDDYCNLPLDQMKKKFKEIEKLENKWTKMKFKEHYKKVKLKNTDIIWAHIGKGAPNKIIGDWPWYKMSVSEYWSNFKREFGKIFRSNNTKIDGEWAEIFWETT